MVDLDQPRVAIVIVRLTKANSFRDWCISTLRRRLLKPASDGCRTKPYLAVHLDLSLIVVRSNRGRQQRAGCCGSPLLSIRCQKGPVCIWPANRYRMLE